MPLRAGSTCILAGEKKSWDFKLDAIIYTDVETATGDLLETAWAIVGRGPLAVKAMQADLRRYLAMHALGGMYADLNTRALQPVDPLLNVHDAASEIHC